MPESIEKMNTKIVEEPGQSRFYMVYPFPDDGLSYSVRVIQMVKPGTKVWSRPFMEVSLVRLEGANRLRLLLKGIDSIFHQWKIWNKETGKPIHD